MGSKSKMFFESTAFAFFNARCASAVMQTKHVAMIVKYFIMLLFMIDDKLERENTYMSSFVIPVSQYTSWLTALSFSCGSL